MWDIDTVLAVRVAVRVVAQGQRTLQPGHMQQPRYLHNQDRRTQSVQSRCTGVEKNIQCLVLALAPVRVLVLQHQTQEIHQDLPGFVRTDRRAQ